MRIFGILLLLLGICSPLRAQQNGLSSEQIRQIDALFARWDRSDGPGLALAVLQQGVVRYQRGYGMANLEYGVPITDSTRFVLASVSKQFTAFAVHLLVREGRIDLDADIRQYIPELPDLGARITPRDLLHHTSGLRESLDLVRLAGWRPEDVLTMEDVLRLAYRQRALNFPPGSEYSYCNLGYVLLAELVRRTSGQPFSVFARERIFAPLGMKDTFFHDDYRMIVPLRAESYRRAGSAWVKVYYPYGTVGSGGLVSTLRDLIIWERFFREPPAGFRELIEAMQQPGRLRDGRELAYGSGLMLGRYRGLRAVWHTGSIAAYRTVLFRLPEAGFSVILLANTAEVNTLTLAQRVADIVLSDRFPEPIPARAESASEAPPNPSPPARAPEQLPPYEGLYYSSELEVFYRIRLEGDSLRLYHPREVWTLQPLGEGRFRIPVGVVRFVPHSSPMELFIDTGRSRNIRFQRVELR